MYSEEDNIPLKRCISVLFDCQRENVQDKSYIETCQEWLKALVISIIVKSICTSVTVSF